LEILGRRILRGKWRSASNQPSNDQPVAGLARREKIAGFPTEHKNRIFIMEAERINAIGSLLADLSTRTLDLRGYL
jgi:hypothetical protein